MLIKRGGVMLDGEPRVNLQRSMGAVDVVLEAASGKARLRRLYQSGSGKVFLSHGTIDEAVFLNTSGGLTGGDGLSYALTLGDGLDVTATTQTAERAYATSGGLAQMNVTLSVGADANLAWLPQETLLYEGSNLRRTTDITLATGANVLICEAVVLGRHAMGEAPKQLAFEDHRRVLSSGRLVWADSLRINSHTLARQSQSALLAKARCFAILALIGPGAAGAAAVVRPVLASEGCETAISAWDGRLILRLQAVEAWPMRQQIARLLRVLRKYPLPRVWQLNGDIP